MATPTMTRDFDDVRKYIGQLANEIAEYASSDVVAETFFREFLKRLVLALGARAGAVWMIEKDQQTGKLFCDIGLAESGFYENPRGTEINQELLRETIASKTTCVFSPEETAKIPLPTPHLILTSGIYQKDRAVAVVQIFQRLNTPKESRSGYLQFLEKMCQYGTQYLDKHQAAATTKSPTGFWNEFEQFVLRLQRSLDWRETTMTAANDGRQIIGCDRVSIAVKRGKAVTISAISGQESVNPRANVTKNLQKLTRLALQSGEPLHISGKIDDLPPPLVEPATDYLHVSGARTVLILPLFRNEPLIVIDKQAELKQKELRKKKVIGAIIVEQLTEHEPSTGWHSRADLIAAHVGTTLSNALELQHVFLLPMRLALGRTLGWLHGRNLVKTVLGLMLATAVGTALAFIPADYRVEGEGQLMPVERKEIFAAWDGEVVEVFVQSNEHVELNQPLLRIKNDDLRAETLAVASELSEKRQFLVATKAEHDEAVKSHDKEMAIRLDVKMLQTRVEITRLEEQLKILRERGDKLTVRSPIAGTIATFQLDQLLRNRPVRKGEVLLQVMDENSPWHLELDVEDSRMGHILKAMDARGDQALPVEYVLVSATEKSFTGEIESLATRTDISEQQGNVVQMHVRIHSEELPNRAFGAEVKAKINCGKRSLFYVLFGDVVEFVQKHLWI
ncbi:MAG: HlyD family efflux transporter periplasmic adaptor subunit [Planctomycetaceae bacterium]